MNRLVTKLRGLLPQGRFAKAVALVAGGTAASQLFGVLVLPVITRLFAPEAFGILAAYVALLMMIQTVAGLRYEFAIPLASTDRDAVVMLLVTLCAVAIFSIGTLTTALLFGTGLFHLQRLDPLREVIWLLPVGVILAGTYQSLRYWAIRDRAYRDIAATTMSQGFGRGLVQLAAGFVQAGPAGLVAGEIVGQGAGIVRLGRSAIKKTKVYWGEISFAEIRMAARRNASFPLMMAPASFLNGAGMQLPTLLLAALYGAEVAGWYFVTQRLLALPVHLLGKAMGQVFLGEAAALARSDPSKLGRMFNTLSRKLLLFGALPTVALIVFGPWAMERFLGPGWGQSGIYLQWLAISFLLKFSFDGLINLAMVERNDYALAWAAIRLVLACGVVLAAHHLQLSATYCVALLSMALALGYLAKLWFWQRAVGQLQQSFR